MRVPEKDMSQQYYKSSKDKSDRPPSSKFVQQRISTYRPILNTAHFIPTLFLLSIIFIPLGIGIWIFSENIPEFTIPYHECKSLENPQLTCEEVLRGNKSLDRHNKEIRYITNSEECHCRVNFELPENMNGTVYMFYALTNFYQNHLKYYLSRDENQLRGRIGELGDLEDPSSSCEPFDRDSNNRIIIPCGLQANTMFNDKIELIHVDPERYHLHINGESSINLIRTGIAWESDKEKFRNPMEFKDRNHEIWKKFTKPHGWKHWLWDMDPSNESNNGLQNEDFIVWMRTAAFPSFRKLFRIVDSSIKPFKNGLPAGKYALNIEYNFEISSFEGTKSIVLSTTRITGGRNHFLAISFMSIGGILMLLTLIFFAIYLSTRKRSLEMKKS